LNDDLQRVLAKHDAIAAGIAVRVEKKPKSLQALVDTEDAANQEESNKEKALVDIEDPTTQDPKQELNQSTSDQSPFEQLALPAPPVANGTAAPKADPGIDLLSWDDTPSTAADSLALVPVTDPLADSTSSNHNALAIVGMFSQGNTTNSSTASADPFGLNSSSTIPGSQPYNIPTPQPLPSQQPQQAAPYANGIAVNAGTSSYDHASQFNSMSSGWNGQATNPVTPTPQQSLNYDDQSGDLPPPPWEAQAASSNEVPNGQLGGMQPLPTLAGQMGGMQQMQPQVNHMGAQMQPQVNHIGAPQTQSMYGNQPGVAALPQVMQPGQMAGTQMQPGFGNQMVMQPGMVGPQMQPGFMNQFGSIPLNSMPGMPFAGMQAPQMQAVMMYPQQMMPGAQYGVMAQQQQMYGGRLAGYMQHPAVAAAHYYSQGAASYGGYPGTNDLSQKMYGLSMQGSSYMGKNSSYQNQAAGTPSPSPSIGQPIKPAKAEDKLFGDLLSVAKKR